MISISEKSWHYRFIDFMRFYPLSRSDLCSYIRGFVFSVIKLAFYIIVGCLGATAAGFILYSMGYALLAGLFGLDTTSLEWCMGASFWGILCVVGALYVIQEANYRRQHKPAGPFKQYLADKHNKVCSLIEFKD